MQILRSARRLSLVELSNLLRQPGQPRHHGAVSPVLVPPVIEPGDLRRHPQPTLTIDELVIRPWRAEDAPAVEAAYSDPLIQQWHMRSMTAEESVDWVPQTA